VKLFSRVRHTITGKTGICMSLYSHNGQAMACVLIDNSLGCGWACWPVEQWEAAP
jgi:hypothetical protein